MLATRGRVNAAHGLVICEGKEMYEEMARALLSRLAGTAALEGAELLLRHEELPARVSDLPCNVRREGG